MQRITGGDLDGELRRYFVGIHQGREIRSTREMIEDIRQRDPAAIGAIVRKYTMGLGAATTDSAREEWRRRVDERDGVYFRLTIDPGIPDIPRSFDGDRGGFVARPEIPAVAVAYEKAVAWANGSGPPLLTLTGSTGTGKTHLAIAAARHIESVVGHANGVVYREEAALVSELMDGIKTNTVEQLLAQLLEVPHLVIDDLGVAALGPFGMEKMDRIVNHRWEMAGQLRTFFTTNLIGNELPVRIASRLRDVNVGASVSISGGRDYRLVKR